MESHTVRNLPAPLTPFIGRERELTDLARLLGDPDCRLLTLVGPGGIGKTRLASEAARRVGAFADGVFFVDLQPASSADLLPSTAADALGFPLSGQEQLRDQLLNYLRDRTALLVLDTFEHLLGGSVLLSDLLRAAPGLKLLVTSREALGLLEEWLYPVEGLPFPGDGEDQSLDAFGAPLLFAACARRVSPGFELAREASDVARICQLVDGMPLALELAASWTRTLDCGAIATEIRRNIDFLATALRNVPERHRSIQAVLQQSLRSLQPEERDVFTRLSVFRGGFRRQAAEQVAGASLPLLAALVDKSLLRWEPSGRYRLHELLRQCAEEELAQTPDEVERVGDRHCAYHAAFLEQRSYEKIGGRQHEATAQIRAEIENVRAAWHWAVSHAKLSEIRRAAPTLALFGHFQARYLEVTQALEQARERLLVEEESEQRDLALVSILVELAWFCIRVGRLDAAEAMVRECQDAYRRLGIPPIPGEGTDPLLPLSLIASIRGDYGLAIDYAEEALRTLEANPHRSNRMYACYVLIGPHLAQGRAEVAGRYAREAEALARELGDQWFLAYGLIERGNVARALGDITAAMRHYQESYALREAFNDPEGMAVALNHLGEIANARQEHDEARRLYQQSQELYQEIGDRGGLATSLAGLGQVALATGDNRVAQERLGEALRLAAEIRYLRLMFSLFVDAADVLLRAGRAARGLDLLAIVRDHPNGDHESRRRAEQVLSRCRSSLSPALLAEVDRPRADDLDSVVASLLDELAADAVSPPSAPLTDGRRPTGPNEELLEPLTARELEVLRLLAAGRRNREIADEIVVAEGTVKAHLNSIFGKLGARNRVEAVARARELDLLS